MFRVRVPSDVSLRSVSAGRLAGLLAAVLTVAGVPTAARAEAVVLNYNVFGPPREVTIGIEVAAEAFKAATNGEYEIKIAYGSALGPEKQTPESVKAGAYDGGQMCAGYYPNKFPLLSVMELPFLAPADLEARAKVEYAVVQHPLIVKEMAERWNIKALAPALLPAYEFMGNKRIAAVDDVKGVKMRISGLNARALQVFGAVPTMVTAPEAYTALERGTIDSFGFPYTYAFGAYKLYEVSEYVTEGVAMSGFMCWQGISLDAWNKLPKAQQDELPTLWQTAAAKMIEAYDAADKKWLPIFHERLEVSTWPSSERRKLAAGAESIWADWVKEQEAAGRPAREILDFVKEQVARHTAD